MLWSPNRWPDHCLPGKAIFINMHVWTIKRCWYLGCKTTRTFAGWWKHEMGEGPVRLLWRGASKFWANMPLQRKSHGKIWETLPLRGSQASSAGQGWGGDGLTGTPKAIPDSIKGRSGSQDCRDSTVIWRERRQSVPWLYLARAGYRISEFVGEKKKGEDIKPRLLSKAIKKNVKKDPQEEWKDICGVRMRECVPSTTLII